MDGKYEKIKMHKSFCKIPVVVFSTTKNLEEVTGVMKWAKHDIVKPVSYDILVSYDERTM